jgi:aryl-alcohol dehydrogenase-like predicted oxidoreductase
LQNYYRCIWDRLKILQLTKRIGMWQLSGGHGFQPNEARSVSDMKQLVDAGFITFDLADHYGPAEDYVGEFRRLFPDISEDVKYFTKWVPRSGNMAVPIVKAALDKSRTRMQQEVLDMVQFHWWDYDDERYIQMLQSAQTLSSASPRVSHKIDILNHVMILFLDSECCESHKLRYNPFTAHS